ncbi:MAG: DNA polymerase I [Leptospiraceae bacterium]|nr:DNA polymerase I [Leptospiraceae bacterium]
MAKHKPTLLIVDGHAMAYRAYYSMQQQNMTHPQTGQPSGAVFGFFRMLMKLSFDEKTSHTVIVWDPPGGRSFRNDLYKEYKANRKPMPDDMRHQIDEIRNLAEQCGFANLMQPGYEADDVIGHLCQAASGSYKVRILSGDKDLYQLLTKEISMLRPVKGVTEFTEITPGWVKEELGIEIKQVIDYMALTGDSTDNIPGAQGVGPKGAVKLIQEYKTIDKIYKNIDKISGKALVKNLNESREAVLLSRQLVTIETSIAELAALDLGSLSSPQLLRPAVLQLFRQAGLNQVYQDLKKRLAANGVESEADMAESQKADRRATEYHLVQTAAELQAALKHIQKKLQKSKKPVISLDTETDNPHPMRARLVGVSLSIAPNEAWYIAALPADSPWYEHGLKRDELRSELRQFFETVSVPVIGQNIKYDLLVLRRHGIELPPVHFDTMIASWLANPQIRRHNLDDMALDLLEHHTISYDSIVGTGRKRTTMDQIDPAQIRDYACEDADITLQLYQRLDRILIDKELAAVNQEIELKLLTVLADMEFAGVAIDRQYFKQLNQKYAKKLSKLELDIQNLAGREFNIRSTKELQTVLYEELGLPHGKKTKTGYSTDQSVLEELAGKHPIIDLLLEFRKYSKLQSTYVESLPEQLHPETGRIHTSFHQAIAATGRLSSVDPNLQNIPIREDSGRAIRRGFIAGAGNELLSLDYSQIELRIMAHYSADPALIQAFHQDDLDIHCMTAASLFGIAEDKVSADQRSVGKSVNFSIIYGVTEFGLARNLSVSREEARSYIDRFFARYPGVKKYMEDSIAFARENGFVQTLSGRKRQIPEIDSSNRFRREGAERMAINSPIQGTSADLIKLAMIEIHAQMQQSGMQSKMILQVHDELLFDVVPAEKQKLAELARAAMENAMQLKVPLRADYRFGANWDEAH